MNNDVKKLCRYMHSYWFIDFLKTKKLRFCSPRKYIDANEMGRHLVPHIEKHTPHKKPSEVWNKIMNLSFISCWCHDVENESYALWYIYPSIEGKTEPEQGIQMVCDRFWRT